MKSVKEKQDIWVEAFLFDASHASVRHAAAELLVGFPLVSFCFWIIIEILVVGRDIFYLMFYVDYFLFFRIVCI